MNKKYFGHMLLAVLLLALLPACRKPVKTTVTICPPKEELEIPSIPHQHCENTLVFDDLAEELVLADDDAYAFNETVNEVLALNNIDEHKMMIDEPELSFEDAIENNELAAVVYFPYDKETPTADQEANLRSLVAKAQQIVKEGKKVACKGHACDWGSYCRVRNMPLSTKRSEWVANYLVQNAHIPAESIKVFGVGSEEPIAFEHTKDAQAPNRRVEIYGLAA